MKIYKLLLVSVDCYFILCILSKLTCPVNEKHTDVFIQISIILLYSAGSSNELGRVLHLQ